MSVVDGNSLSAAARARRLSLPAVSRQLRALESELGASLIVRSTRRLTVTDAGRRWYEQSVQVLRDVDAAITSVRASKTARGTLVVNTSLTFGLVLVVPRLRKLTEQHPHLAVHLRLDDQLVDLVGEGIDVALRAGSPPPDSTAYVAHPVMEMQRILVASPRWLRKHGTPREPLALARHPCLVQITAAGSTVRWRLRRGDQDETVAVHGVLSSATPLVLRDLAIDGAGIAYLPDWLVVDPLARGQLRRVLPAWASPPLTAWAVHRTELRGDPRVRAFLDAIAAA